MFRRRVAEAPLAHGPADPTRLHVGCGSRVLDGWLNIDLKPGHGVIQHDVATGLPWSNLEAVFAEHFLEHLEFGAARGFLRACRLALREDGVLRLSTPNLDWVWRTQYHPNDWQSSDEAVRDCFWMNKAFRAWGHCFLYNAQTLERTVLAAGFAEVCWLRYGESKHAALRGLEGHERYPDTAELPHVLVAEASGIRSVGPDALGPYQAEYVEAMGSR